VTRQSDRPSELPAEQRFQAPWLVAALQSAGLGEPLRQRMVGGTLRVAIASGAGAAIELILEPPPRPGQSPPYRLPFEGAHLRIAYAGSDGGEQAVALCRQAGLVLDGHGAAMQALFEQAAAAARRYEAARATTSDDGPPSAPEPAPGRKLEPPDWMAEALDDLGPFLSAALKPGELVLTLAQEGAPAVVRVLLTERLAFKPAWTGSLYGIAYQGSGDALAALALAVGERLEPLCGRIRELLDRPAPVRPGSVWSDPAMARLLEMACGETPDTAEPLLDEVLARGPGGADSDAAAMAALAMGRFGDVLALASATDHPGPLVQAVGSFLRGERHDALERLESLTRGTADPMVLFALADLAEVMKAPEHAARWHQARADRLTGSARGMALLGLVDILADSDADPNQLRQLVDEAADLVRTAPDQQARLAETAWRAGCFDVAEAALKLHREDTGSAPSTLELARLALWRGDGAAALEMLAQVGTLDGEAARADAATIEAAGRLLTGADPRSILPDLEQAARHHPSPTVAATWRAEALMRAERWDEAREAENLARGHLHTLTNSVVGTLIRARQLVAEGHEQSPWVMRRMDLYAMLYGRLDGWVPAEASQRARASVQQAEALLTTVHAGLGGNRTGMATRVDEDGHLHRLVDPGSPRTISVKHLHRLPMDGLDVTLARMRGLPDRWPESPQPPCYLGELLLWANRLDEAEACFQEGLDRGGTRWAYIGQGAIRTLRGDNAGALERFDACIYNHGELEGATLVVYRGELHRRAGRLDEARADLEAAVKARRTRVGAWANLALTRLAQGDAEGALRAAEEIVHRVPHLVRRAAAAPSDAGLRSPEALQKVLTAMLEMMGGNRSSALWSHFAAPGHLVVLPNPEPLREWAQLQGSVAERLALEAG